MSADPQQMQQLLAMYRSQFPQGAPTGAPNPMAGAPVGGANAAQLLAALLGARRQRQLQQQVPQPGQPAVPTPSQGITPGGGLDSGSSSGALDTL